MNTRYSAVVLVVVLVAGLSACTGGDVTDTTELPLETSTTASLPTTTSPPSTTTSTPATTTSTTESPTTTSAPDDTTTSSSTTSVVTDLNSLAEGSGCTPGAGDLPDGEWFGIVVDTDDDEIEFDLACWFIGDAAERAAAEDGTEVNNDYYVRNVNPLARSVDVGDDALVVWLTNLGSPQDTQETDYATWLTARADRDDRFQPAVWITVEDQEVVLIIEQWVP